MGYCTMYKKIEHLSDKKYSEFQCILIWKGVCYLSEPI